MDAGRGRLRRPMRNTTNRCKPESRRDVGGMDAGRGRLRRPMRNTTNRCKPELRRDVGGVNAGRGRLRRPRWLSLCKPESRRGACAT
jgi:hypothetical protein